jgi:hypothetical protein
VIRVLAATVLTAFLTSCASGGEGNPGPPIAPGTTALRATFEILVPRAGDTITLPTEVRYRVDGLDRGYLRVSLLGVAEARPLEIPFEGREGIVLLPDDKAAFFVGHRDLLFRLMTRDGTLVADKVVIRDLTIQGRRGT